MEGHALYALLWDLLIPYFVLCLVFYLVLAAGTKQTSIPGKSVLFVVAHPDDECMFFAPALSTSVRAGDSVFILCLSTGNFYQQGETRRSELVKSCGILGVPEANLTIIDNGSLQDDPNVLWDQKECGKVILTHINTIKPDKIFTFDSVGVSGHLNHRSVYVAIQYLLNDSRLPAGVSVYSLDSVSLPHQYLTLLILDLPYSFLSADHTTVMPWRDIFKAQRACLAHWSQMEWFRLLHLTFSRYMIINSFHKLSYTPSRENERLKS